MKIRIDIDTDRPGEAVAYDPETGEPVVLGALTIDLAGRRIAGLALERVAVEDPDRRILPELVEVEFATP